MKTWLLDDKSKFLKNFKKANALPWTMQSVTFWTLTRSCRHFAKLYYLFIN